MTAAEKQKRSVIKRWKEKKKRYDFVKRRLKRILSLSMQGWPKMYSSSNPDYLKWLDIVYEAKERGIYSLNTANCDVIANIHRKAVELTNKKDEQ